MKVTLLVVAILLALCVCQTEGWWGSRSSRSSRTFGSKVKTVVNKAKGMMRKAMDKVKKAGSFGVGAAKGSVEMAKAYKQMRDSNFIGGDKYFHAKGNHNAAKHGPGGKFAAKVISDAREGWQGSVSGRGHEDTAADQAANEWGRNGGDPNKFRPKGLDKKYRK